MEMLIRTWLEDIANAIEEIDSFLPKDKVFSEFKKDIKTRKAIERNIEIIGEALNRILNVNPNIGITNARKIVDTRNRIIHGYDSVSEEIIWAIVIRDIPFLKSEILKILSN